MNDVALICTVWLGVAGILVTIGVVFLQNIFHGKAVSMNIVLLLCTVGIIGLISQKALQMLHDSKDCETAHTGKCTFANGTGRSVDISYTRDGEGRRVTFSLWPGRKTLSLPEGSYQYHISGSGVESASYAFTITACEEETVEVPALQAGPPPVDHGTGPPPTGQTGQTTPTGPSGDTAPTGTSVPKGAPPSPPPGIDWAHPRVAVTLSPQAPPLSQYLSDPDAPLSQMAGQLAQHSYNVVTAAADIYVELDIRWQACYAGAGVAVIRARAYTAKGDLVYAASFPKSKCNMDFARLVEQVIDGSASDFINNMRSGIERMQGTSDADRWQLYEGS